MSLSRRLRNGFKGLWVAPKNLLGREFGFPLKPELMVFEITDRCNSRCTHCSIWKKKVNVDEELTREEIKKAITDPIFKKLKAILITGGEAFLRKDLQEIILDMHKTLPKINIWLSTNGLLPERILKMTNFLKTNNVNIGIGVSVDALGEKHDIIRGIPGNFKKVDYLLKKLVKIREKYGGNLPITIGFTLSKYTAKDYESVKNYAKKLNVEFLTQTYNEAEYYGNDITTKDKKIDDHGNEDLINVINSLPSSLLKKISIKSLKGKKMKFWCFALNKFFLLRPTGDVAPCLNWCTSIAGNIKKESPSEIWAGEKAKELRKKIKKCSGCLNDWCTSESFRASFFPLLPYYIHDFFKKRKIL